MSDDVPTGREVRISVRFLSWIGGGIAALLAIVVAWFTVWDRIDNHWRLETIQKAQDDKTKAELARVEQKADEDNKRLARRAEVGRAWLFWTIADSKATQAEQWADVCKPLRLPLEVCARMEKTAAQYRSEASSAKKDATDAGKEK